MNIDFISFDKTRRGIGNGFDRRTNNIKPASIVVHTTNGRKNSNFLKEAAYIYGSNNISSHYLIGKDGSIIQFLSPAYRAWHAGAVNDSRFNNNNSIGIECHYTPGEGAWTTAMHHALTELVNSLDITYNIKSPELIETHRHVAIPVGRKIDPSGFPDAEFYVWRNRLFITETTPAETKYKVIAPEVYVRKSPEVLPNNIAGKLYKGDIFTSAALKTDEGGSSFRGINTWAHVTHGNSQGKPVDGLGFVHTANLTIITE